VSMPGFTLAAVCRASPVTVFKLLHDPSRFPDWWEGMERVEEDAGDGEVRRYMREWPDFAYPTRLGTAAGGGVVTISCLLSDIVHEWRLTPDPAGCGIAVRVELPETEEARMPAQRSEVGASLSNLAALAEAEDDAL
jgi:hypothetical protein